MSGAASAAPFLFGGENFSTEGAESTAAKEGHRYGRVGMELTALQMQVLERLFAAGFRPIAIPPYENAFCMHRGECAALLAPVANGGLREVSPPTLLVDGNLSVRLKKKGGDVFVWKKTEVPATEEKLKELAAFREELSGILELASTQ